MKDLDKPKALDLFIKEHKIRSTEKVTYIHHNNDGDIIEVHTRPNVDESDPEYRNFKTYKA